MLYKISVFEIKKGIRNFIYSKQLEAIDARRALGLANVKFTPERVIEIRQMRPVERLEVSRRERDGVI